jgi:hypothetical protein
MVPELGVLRVFDELERLYFAVKEFKRSQLHRSFFGLRLIYICGALAAACKQFRDQDILESSVCNVNE